MPSGGARARSGPAPDPNALRRERDSADWVTLPAEGRQAPPPEWPLSPKANKRQAELWARVWATPQAVMWEARGQELEVALYVRRFSEAEKPNATTSLTSEVRRMMENLGLSSMGLRVNRWRLGEPDQQQPAPRPARAGGSRDRLRIVDSGAG